MSPKIPIGYRVVLLLSRFPPGKGLRMTAIRDILAPVCENNLSNALKRLCQRNVLRRKALKLTETDKARFFYYLNPMLKKPQLGDG